MEKMVYDCCSVMMETEENAWNWATCGVMSIGTDGWHVVSEEREDVAE